MNELIMSRIEETEVQTISSVEVAEMMSVAHKSLLRKIEGINKSFTQHKVVPSKYWTEGSYKDRSGKSNKCYNITKLGCEFLAHKMIGDKGNLFTDRYMNKFEEMKKTIRSMERVLSEKEMLQLQILNGSDEERVIGLKRFEEMVQAPLLETIAEQKPKVDFHDSLEDSKDSISIGNFANVLKDDGVFKGGRNKLFELLRSKGYLKDNNEPYRKYIEMGIFKEIEYTYGDGYGSRIGFKTLVTSKGQIYLAKRLRNGDLYE